MKAGAAHGRALAWLCCVALLMAAHASASESSAATGWERARRRAGYRTEVYKDRFAKLLVGNPAHTRTFLLDASCGEGGRNERHAFVLFSEPGRQSKTYSSRVEGADREREDRFKFCANATRCAAAAQQHDGRTVNLGSELFHFGPRTVRLPVKYDAYARDYSMPIRYDGVACMGRGSALWDVWSSHTLSATELCLGYYDVSLSRDAYRSFDVPCESREDGTHGNGFRASYAGRNYTVIYDPSSSVTRLPPEIYERLPPMWSGAEDASDSPWASLTVMAKARQRRGRGRASSLREQNVAVELRFDREDLMQEETATRRGSTVAMQPRGSDEIVLGHAPCLNLVSFANSVSGDRHVSPMYDMFDYGGSKAEFDGACSLLIGAIAVFWLTAVVQVNRGDVRVPKCSAPSDAPNARSAEEVLERLRSEGVGRAERPKALWTRMRFVRALGRLEVLAYLACLLLFCERAWAFDAYRFFAHYFCSSERCAVRAGDAQDHRDDYGERREYEVLCLYVVANCAAGLLMAGRRFADTMLRGGPREAKRRASGSLELRRCFAESALFLVLWSFQVSRHTTVYHHLFSMFVFALYSVLRVSAALSALIEWQWRWPDTSGVREGLAKGEVRADEIGQTVVLLVSAAFSVALFHAWSALPFVDRFWYGFGGRQWSAAVWTCLFVAVPSLVSVCYFFVANLDAMVSKTISKAKIFCSVDGHGRRSTIVK